MADTTCIFEITLVKTDNSLYAYNIQSIPVLYQWLKNCNVQTTRLLSSSVSPHLVEHKLNRKINAHSVRLDTYFWSAYII